jgi:formylglycine-generating enzyme required for sulfatase activity
MSQGLRQKRLLVNAIGLVIAVSLVSAFTSAVVASQVKEQDPVPMVVVPAGPFLMGNPESKGRADEWPQRQVYLDTFAIDQVEVTNERYMNFVRATGHRNPPNPYASGLLLSEQGIEQLPVVQVTWYDAKAYCVWAKKRLPTEAEWEKAARGTDGRKFPWGNESPSRGQANFDRDWDGDKTMHRVGSLEAGNSPYGVKDMSGNAREWVQDWYDPQYYAQAPAKNPQGPDKGVVRVIRGGSWHSPLSDITATARGRGGFALQTHGTGFRCARTLSSEIMEPSRDPQGQRGQ